MDRRTFPAGTTTLIATARPRNSLGLPVDSHRGLSNLTQPKGRVPSSSAIQSKVRRGGAEPPRIHVRRFSLPATRRGRRYGRGGLIFIGLVVFSACASGPGAVGGDNRWRPVPTEPVQCPGTSSWNGVGCVSPTSCPSGEYWDSAARRCQAIGGAR